MANNSTGEMIGPTIIPKPLTECRAGELVRLESTGAWAIVANDSENNAKVTRIFVITGKDAPNTFLLQDSTEACLSYGTGFEVLPVHSSFAGMHVTGREGFAPIGKLIFSRAFERDASTSRYFAASAGQARFLNLETFQAVGEPTGYRALFQDWEVLINWPGQHEMVTLVRSADK